MSSFKKLRLDPETPIQGTSRNLSNQPGANDGRSYLDSSSFSSSTSGGSGTCMRSAGPFRTRYSQPLRIPSPNTSSFSRFAPYYFGKERRSTLKVPLIRARRDESESDSYRPSSRSSLNSSLGGDSTSSATTSTAQRIIETLQNLSTPVMNAGKIRIDQDIKAVQPLPFGSGSPYSRYSPGSSMNRSTGPPKMCSSLLMSTPSAGNQISPVSNLGDQRRLFCIPRMIDAATNTEKEIDVTSPSQMQKSNKVEFKTSVSSAASRQTTGYASKSVATAKDDDSDDEYHECSSNFTFSTGWSPQIFDPYFSNEKNNKSVEKGNLRTEQQQPNLLNGYKDTPGPSFFSTSASSSSNTLPKPTASGSSSGSSGFGGGSAPPFSFGSSPLKSTSSQGKSSGLLESSLSGPKPPESALPPASAPFNFGNKDGSAATKSTFSFGKESAKDSKPITASSDKVDAAANDNLTTAKSPFSSSSSSTTAKTATTLPPLTAKSSGSKWRCSTCMVENELSAQACVCCNEKQKNPNQTQFKPASVSSNKWRCPTCMVENEFGTAACVCCSEKNPNPVSAPAASTPVAKKWRCPTCMVENDPTVAACVCCSEKNPSYRGEKKDEGVISSSAPTSAFKFGAPSSTGAGASTSGSNTFSFGQPASAPKLPSSPFTFGVPPASSSSATSVPPSAPTVVSTASSAVPSTPQVPISTPSLPLSTQPINTNSPFKFGGPSPSGITLPSTTSSFGFSSLPTSSQPATTTNASTSSPSVFGNLKPMSETTNNNSLSTPAANPVFGSNSFQSAASQPTTSSFNFSGASKPAADPPKATPFSFGAGPKPSFGGSFPFSASPVQSPAQPAPPTSVMSATPQVPSSTSAAGMGAPPSFPFGSNPATSPFGQIQSPPSNPMSQTPSTGAFGFGGAATPNQMNATPAPAPNAFNFTPNLNLNFGQAPGSNIPFGNPTQPTPNAGTQPPQLFQFSATPSDSPGGGGRQIKKAVRRFKK